MEQKIKETGRYRTTLDKPIHRLSKISRADLAHYLLSHLDNAVTFRAQADISH